MKSNSTTLLNPTQATTGRNATSAPNPQEQERQQSAQEVPIQPTAEVIEQKRAADSVAWQELLTQGPVNFSRVGEQVEPQQLAASAEDEEKRAAVLETLRIINERPVLPEVTEQQAAVAEAERIIVEPIPVQHLRSSGLIAQVKEGIVDLIRHINFKVFFSDLKEAWGDLWNQIRGKKEKPTPQPDLKEQEKIQNQQFQQQVNTQAERVHQTAKLGEIFQTTVRHEVAGSTTEQRAKEGGYQAGYRGAENTYGIAMQRLGRLEAQRQAQQPQGLPEVATKRKPGLITVEQATNTELIGGSGRVSGPHNKG